MEREHFVQITARALGLSEESIKGSLKRLPAQADPLKYPDISNGRKDGVPPLARSPVELRSEQLRAVLHAYPHTPLAKRVKSEYLRITEARQLPDGVPQESTLFQAEQAFGEEPAEDAADELIRAFEEAVIREAYQKAVMALHRAETKGDAASILEAQNLCAKLSARLAAFGEEHIHI